MADTKKNRKKNRKTAGSRRFLIQNPTKMARRDVKLALRPQLQDLKREMGNVKDDYGEYMNQLGFLYNLVGENLGGIGKQQDRYTTRAANLYGKNAGGLLDSLGLADSTAPDAAAWARALGSQAEAGQRALGTMASDAAQNMGSLQTQGELERLVAGRNAMGKQSDMLDDLRQQRQDILSNRPLMLKQRTDELRQLAWEQWMAEREFRLRTASARGDERGWDAFYEWMRQQQKAANKKRRNRRNGEGSGSGHPTAGGGNSTTGGPTQ